MDNKSQKDELQVENYDAMSAEAKRKRILKRVGIGIGVAIVAAILGYFGLDRIQNNYNPDSPEVPIIDDWCVPGGAGAWYSSVVELDD